MKTLFRLLAISALLLSWLASAHEAPLVLGKIKQHMTERDPKTQLVRESVSGGDELPSQDFFYMFEFPSPTNPEAKHGISVTIRFCKTPADAAAHLERLMTLIPISPKREIKTLGEKAYQYGAMGKEDDNVGGTIMYVAGSTTVLVAGIPTGELERFAKEVEILIVAENKANAKPAVTK